MGEGSQALSFLSFCMGEGSQAVALYNPVALKSSTLYNNALYNKLKIREDYVAEGEKKKLDFHPAKGYKQVQIADETIYEKICCEVNHQMKKAFSWWKKMSK